MQDKIEQVSTTVSKISATIAVTPGVASIFSLQFWNENSSGIVAMCALVGALVTVATFCLSQWRIRQKSKIKDKV